MVPFGAQVGREGGEHGVRSRIQDRLDKPFPFTMITFVSGNGGKQMIRIAHALAFNIFLLPFACLASAQTLVDAGDPEEIENIARGYGSATLTKDDAGDPMVRGRIDGTIYLVVFYGCDDGINCRTIDFSASWDEPDTTHAEMREWNQRKRFGAAYLDEDGDPTVEWSVNLFGGVPVENLDDTFDYWRIVLEDFEEFIR